MLASNAIGCGFDSLSGKSKDYLLLFGVCLLNQGVRIKTDRLTRNQDNVFELSHMFTTDSCFSKLTLCIDNIHRCLWWKQQLNYLKIAETSVVLNVSNGVPLWGLWLYCYRFIPSLYMNQVPGKKLYIGQWPYNNFFSSQCSLTTQIEQVQDKLV